MYTHIYICIEGVARYSQLVPEEGLLPDYWQGMKTKLIHLVSQRGNNLEGILYKVIMAIVSEQSLYKL